MKEGLTLFSSKYDWEIRPNKASSEQIKSLASDLGISQLVAQLLINRGFQDPDEIKHFLSPDTSDLNDPFLFNDMDKAIERIESAIAENEKITIYGDYDADGITSTSIIYETLLEIGANVTYYIPNRFKDGYGPNADVYKQLIADGTKLIITVDNGVSGYDAVEVANQLDCDVIITDHHELPDKLPNAYAIIHADLSPNYPFKELSGAGIAFKVATALSDEIPQEKLDLAAIGTIADLVSLTKENRALVQFGLNVIHLTERPGLKRLVKRNQVKIENIDEEDIGFKIAPSLNALGRMGDASQGVELLTTTDDQIADDLAKQTEKQNEERKTLVADLTEKATEIAESPENTKRNTLVINGRGWHTGILGIVASRLTDKFNKPTIVIGEDPETGIAKGSGRSISGFDLFQALHDSTDLMDAFGGHEMAIGLTIQSNNISQLADNLEQVATSQDIDCTKKPQLKLDYEVSADDINNDLYDDLALLSPFGTDNEKPAFAIKPNLLGSITIIGKTKEHLKFDIIGKNSKVGAIDFGAGQDATEIRELDRNLKVAGTIGKNEFRGRTNLQVMVSDLEVAGSVILDKRTNNLVAQMFEEDGQYLFFNPKLMEKLSRYLNANSEAQLASDFVAKNDYKKLFVVDCPPSLIDLKNVIKESNNSQITLYLFKPHLISNYGMPKREQYAKLFKFIKFHNNVSLRKHLKSISNELKINQNLLVFMIKVFNELGFVTINDGMMNTVASPQKQSLSSAVVYQRRLQEIEIENQLINLNQNALINLINEMQD